ncbi:MAG: protein-L-isoaspartate(D-aspartate) O-methyltransferase [Pseudomonadales bacterium]|nr:protein-L-isoaspartate(D-aspartate) O-methyltransferase [Pseudomonadales bacterium]
MTSPRTRDRMVERLQEQGINNLHVLDVMRRVPRHLFIEEALAHRAYEDSSLPIGHGQTISQPWVVAKMTEALLEAGGGHGHVLEVGTGCGYQTAVLAELFDQVVSLERVKPLQDKAREKLQRLNYLHCELHYADGMQGWPEHAPFDGILAAAAPWGVPQALVDQLGPQGCLVLPVGRGEVQELLRIQRCGEEIQQQTLGQVRFVPMLGGLRGF